MRYSRVVVFASAAATAITGLVAKIAADLPSNGRADILILSGVALIAGGITLGILIDAIRHP